jgi:hypothetical protein
LKSPKAISKPPDLAEIAPVKLEMGSTVVVAGTGGARIFILGIQSKKNSNIPI